MLINQGEQGGYQLAPCLPVCKINIKSVIFAPVFCSIDPSIMLSHFFQQENNTLSFTREQASQFAKEVAGDYNPLHNEDAKRFCVPGDLLFSVVLSKYGISQNMQFSFNNMITEKSMIAMPEPLGTLEFSDGSKSYVTVTRSGENNTDPASIESIIKHKSSNKI